METGIGGFWFVKEDKEDWAKFRIILILIDCSQV